MNRQEETVETILQNDEKKSAGKTKYAMLTLRAVVAFLVLGVIIAILAVVGYRGYPTVATWGEPGNHATVVYEGETYQCLGYIGEVGISKTKYPLGKILGKVEDDGLPYVTEVETLENGETAEVDPPKADPTLATDHAYIVYSVKDKEGLLLVLERDGEYYVYESEAAEEATTAAG